jgi:uncharacterized protein YaiI (UPF0178 family)
MTHIYVDADACPVKDEVIRVSSRHQLQVTMVSNQGVRASVAPNVQAVLVGPEFDAADNWIAEHIAEGDIVITADIQLAGRCLAQKAHALNPNGNPFNAENIGTALAMRELNQYLREAGEISGYNASFSKQNRSDFLQALDTLIQREKRRAPKA